MELWSAMTRAKRGFRDDLRLHVVAITSLVVAFLCLATALLSLQNLSRVAERWSHSQHLTIYLKGGASESDIGQLRLVLESLGEVAQVAYVSAAQAKQQFLEQADLGSDLSSLPADTFPASLEIMLHDTADSGRINAIAERVRQFAAVEEVETYRDWFGQVSTLVAAGQGAVGLLVLLVGVCVLAVIGNTIRLAVANRRSEIQVLKLCGATDGFVRTPFLVEGVAQATVASILAVILLGVAYLATRGQVEATLGAITGVKTVFIQPLVVLCLVLGAALVGAVGSALSLRRYLAI